MDLITQDLSKTLTAMQRLQQEWSAYPHLAPQSLRHDSNSTEATENPLGTAQNGAEVPHDAPCWLSVLDGAIARIMTEAGVTPYQDGVGAATTSAAIALEELEADYDVAKQDLVNRRNSGLLEQEVQLELLQQQAALYKAGRRQVLAEYRRAIREIAGFE